MTHDSKHYLYFYYGELTILIYKFAWFYYFKKGVKPNVKSGFYNKKLKLVVITINNNYIKEKQ